MEEPEPKSLNQIKNDLSAVFADLRAGEIEIKVASELANIVGKFLKADQLQQTREMFLAGHRPRLRIDREE